MQQLDNGQYIFSPSDLVNFLGCHHATFRDFKNLIEKIEFNDDQNFVNMLKSKGMDHERLYLQTLKNEGKSVVDIPKNVDWETQVELTVAACQSGADVIYQAVLYRHPWRGYADFLIKCDAPSILGAHSYEVLDTKLGRSAQPKHIMQLCAYSDLLTDIQGVSPKHMHLFFGNNKKESFNVSDFHHYYTTTRIQFEEFISTQPKPSYPERCAHCELCRWKAHCEQQWKSDDHLVFVANIQRTQIKKINESGIQTLKALAESNHSFDIKDLNRDVLNRLRSQATLQLHKITTNENIYEILPIVDAKGFARMPLPDVGDIFFDMEGDPLHPDGLEYLFGAYYYNGVEYKFREFWAHNHEEEKAAFEEFMFFIGDHLSIHPNAHIYHYNHYETTALKRLSCRYAVFEEQLDNLLRYTKCIDLYMVVREAIRTSEPGYSIKNLETFYMKKRENAVSTAADSIVVYNNWRITGLAQYLQEIADYNEVDCVSTQHLRDWLLSIKPQGIPFFTNTPEKGSMINNVRKEWEVEYENYINLLNSVDLEHKEIADQLSNLLEFHRREDKSQWWSMFARQNKSEDELIDDADCLGSLTMLGNPIAEKQSLLYTYKFPPQDCKLKVGSKVVNTETSKSSGEIYSIDDDALIIEIKHGIKNQPLPQQLSIGPNGPIDSKAIRASIYRFTNLFIKNNKTKHCGIELLSRAKPRIKGKSTGMPTITSKELIHDALESILNLDHSYMFIQGPPGAGKTYVSSHLIVSLMMQGKKIGVTSNSHKAIHNLLEQVEKVALEKNFSFNGYKKASDSSKDSFYEGQFIHNETKTNKVDLSASLFAGTVWFFSEEYMQDNLDYLFIDEAGQVSTTNVIAMSTSTKNIILVGDQMQLGQPIQGVHPGDAGLSVLEYLLGEHSTIPPDRGIFLPETRRMRPSICQFISEAFYDGRLEAHEEASKRSLSLTNCDLPNEGIVYIPVRHDGCSQKCEAEGILIKEKYSQLLGQQFRDKNGLTRKITKDDILVVTPYNVQVNHLHSILPEHARVGTVDKFQGQEAPIVLISMVTSSAENMPRDIEFLYSKNRLNVAISRAQCLAVVVASPKLVETPCKTVNQMRLVNTFCWVSEYSNILNTSAIKQV